MTATLPFGAGDPDPRDLDAAEQLERNEAGRLNLVRARAEKWIGGTTALSGALGTVLVVKGRDNVTQISMPARVATGCALAVALMLLAYGTFRAYRAAFGAPGGLQEIRPIPLRGLHDRLAQARHKAAKDALKDLNTAIKTVLAAIALIAVGVGITWYAPTGTTTPSKSVCIYSDGKFVVELASESAAIKKSATTATIDSCPKR